MFGYVVINEPELKIKDYREYRGVYCGLCQTLRRKYGPFGQLCLNNDMTFMAMLHMSLYEDEEMGKERMYRCLLHPMHKLKIYENPCLDYAADMTMVLSYYLFRDHWMDDRKPQALVQMHLIQGKVRKLTRRYPRQYRAVKNYVFRLEAAERSGEKDLDVLAGLTGTMLGEIMNWKEDIWSEMLTEIGFYLGKFIYLMDAYEDLDRDVKKHRFNPLAAYRSRPDFEKRMFSVLDLMMADCARSFEKLPLSLDVEILRNILYAGVWSKYIKIRNDKNKTEEVKDESL